MIPDVGSILAVAGTAKSLWLGAPLGCAIASFLLYLILCLLDSLMCG
jgi:hypothetical protein